MPQPITLTFQSRLPSSPEAVWDWITSVRGITLEMQPWLRMTVPRAVRNLADVEFRPGERLFRSHLFLFGVVPIDYSDLTLLELTPGKGFVEQSKMGSMKLWRHERHIEVETNGDGVTLTDRLTFEPKLARSLVHWFIARFFAHRHAVLRAHLGEALSSGPGEPVGR